MGTSEHLQNIHNIYWDEHAPLEPNFGASLPTDLIYKQTQTFCSDLLFAIYR